MQGDKSIVIVPTVYVNNVAERGGISTAAVLSTICAGYKSGTAPDVRFFFLFLASFSSCAGGYSWVPRIKSCLVHQ